MARFHGKDCRVYFGKRDVSGDLVSIDVSATAETHDVTTFASADWRSFKAGLGSWEASFSALYETEATGTVTTIGRQLEALLGSNATGTTIVSVYVGDADSTADTGWLGGEATLTKIGQPVSVADIIKVSATLQGNGGLGTHAVLLSPLATVSATANGTSVDNAASSANGYRANLHVTAATGTGGTIKVQHSVDNSTWVDLATFTAATAATSETKAATGTVNRYVRSVATINATSSLTFVCGIAR